MTKQDKKKGDSGKVKKIDLRVTENEFSAINAKCQKANLNRSTYIIQAVLNEKVLTHIDAQVIFQLRKIGNNINQMTKQIHIISKFVDEKANCLPDIFEELKSTNEILKGINDYIIHTGHAGKN